MSVLPPRNEILINGAWVNVTSKTRGGPTISIQRGFSSEQSNLSAGSCSYTLGNPDGQFSNRNPNSPYFGKIGRNVQTRSGVDTGVTSLRLIDGLTSTGNNDGADAYTADKAVLDIVGDLEIRIDAEADDWYGRTGHILAGKYIVTGNQRSWALISDSSGYLQFFWSTDGTSAGRVFTKSTITLPADTARLAIKVTLDVNNGAAGNTVTFFTAPTLSGTYTQFGAAVVTAGITSVFSGSAPLEVGNTNNHFGRGTFVGAVASDPFVGKIYGFELRNGIAGTVAARADFTAQAAGTTTWSDGLGTPNTWLLFASAEISSMDWRFWGELSNPNLSWDPTGRDVVTSVVAGDLIQRLSNDVALRSPIYRNLRRFSPDGYWPMEDGFDATSITADTGAQGGFTDANFSVATGLPGSAGALIFTDDSGTAYGNAIPGAATGVASFLLYWRTDANPTSGTGVVFMNAFFTGGTLYRAELSVNNTSYTLNVYNASGTQVLNAIFIWGGAEPKNFKAMRIMFTQNGANVDWDWSWYEVGAPIFLIATGTINTLTVGRPRGWQSPGFTGKFGFELGHVLMSRNDLEFTTFATANSTNGYLGEHLLDRINRLVSEENSVVPVYIIGDRDNTATMGIQDEKSFLDLIAECADVGAGLLYAAREKYGLVVRLRSNMVNRSGPVFDYAAAVFSGTLTPDEGNFGIRNDVTASRDDGTKRRFVKTSGPLNANDPRVDPQGINPVPGSITRNAYPDSALDDQAGYAVFLGTWDEARYTSITWELHRTELQGALGAAMRRLELGSAFAMRNPPAWTAPGDSLQLLRGYRETITNGLHTISGNAMPYGPYLVNDFSGAATSRYVIADASLSTLKASITTTATSLVVVTPPTSISWLTGSPLGTNAYKITLGGEIMTVTAMTAGSVVGANREQTATVTRSVNGIVKAHSAADLIEITEPFYIDL